MAITEITRRALVDDLNHSDFWWAGRLDEASFLARLYPLDDLPSYDRRYPNAAGDIFQHRENNLDWDADWIFSDERFGLAKDDTLFLRFLAETVHPEVRPNKDEAAQLVEMYNTHLRPDGWELSEVNQISGRPVYAPRSRLTIPHSVRQLAVRAGDSEYLVNQITRMESAIESDPELAIGTAKELVETTCKAVLVELGVTPDKDWDLPRLVRETGRLLKVTPDTVESDTRGADSIRRVLGGLAGVVAGIGELRNLYGTGHGKNPKSSGLAPRHARLAVGAASTFATFIFETYERRSQ